MVMTVFPGKLAQLSITFGNTEACALVGRSSIGSLLYRLIGVTLVQFVIVFVDCCTGTPGICVFTVYVYPNTIRIALVLE